MNIFRRFNLQPVEARSVEGSSELPPISGQAAVYFDPANADATQYTLAPHVVERMSAGIFEPALANEDDILALQDHDPALFLGRRSSGTLKVALNERGLGYEVQTPPTQVGQDTISLIHRRDITGSSFSMWKPTGAWSFEGRGTEKRCYVRTVQSFEKIVDMGPVLQPAYPGTSANVGSRSCGITCVGRSAGPPAEIAAIESELAAFIQANWYQAEAQLRMRQIDLRRAG